MSTYLQGISDIGFNPIQYSPNLPYMQQALQKATYRYEKNYDQISNQYSKIADSLLLNPENNEFRKKFLDDSKNALKTLSTQDLSVQQNINDAEQLFAPFWEDEDMLADYKISKEYQQQVNQYNVLKNSDKKEDRDRAWDYGLSYVQLTAKEMALAKRGDGSIQNVKVRPYIPYTNVNEEITKELKNLGYGDGIIQTIVKDGYINQITNGNGTGQIYESVINQILKNRPDLTDIFKVQGVTQFQSSVFKYLNENPGINQEKAVHDIKQNYANSQISKYQKYIDDYNSVINGSVDTQGLKKELELKEDEIYTKLGSGLLTTDSQEFKSFIEKKNKLNDLNNLITNYSDKIKGLQSEDFYSTKGEDYFTEIYKDDFVLGNAKSREAAFAQKVTSDPSYVASQKIDAGFNTLSARLQNQWEMQERRFQNDKNVDLNDDGVIDENDAVLGGSGNKTGTKSLHQPTKEEILLQSANTPTVGEVYGKSLDYTTSKFSNFKNNLENYGYNMVANAEAYLNESELLSKNIPNIKEYVDYLTHYAKGGKQSDKYFNGNNVKSVFNELVNQKILSPKYKDYNYNINGQIQELVSYVDSQNNKNFSNGTNIERTKSRIEYEANATKYLAAKSLYDDFYNNYIKIKPKAEYSNVLTQNKNGQYIPITKKEIQSIPLTQHSTLYGVPSKKITEKLPDHIAELWLNGQIKTEKWGAFPKENVLYDYGNGHYLYNDEKTKKQWDLSNIVNVYGIPQDVSKKIENYNKDINTEFSKYISKKGNGKFDDWIMSRELKYSNIPSDGIEDKALMIANSAIEKNRDRLLTPTNYDVLTSDGTSKDGLNKAIASILNNRDLLNRTLANSYLSFTGSSNETSNIRLEFKRDELYKLITAEEGSASSESKQLKSALNSIATHGITFDVDKSTFREFAKDDYMTSIVTDKLLNQGVRATDYEKNNLYYDYNLVPGFGDNLVLTYSMKTYDPNNKQFIDGEIKTQSFPKSLGIDNILRLLRDKGLENAYQINSYLKNQQRQLTISPSIDYKNNPNLKDPNETMDQYKMRIKKMHGIN